MQNFLKIFVSVVPTSFIISSELTVTDSREIYTPYEEGNEDSAPKFNGTYNSYANLVSLSISYSFNIGKE